MNGQLLSIVEKTCRKQVIFASQVGAKKLKSPCFKVRNVGPKYLDQENLLAVSQALQNVDILCTPFETVLERAIAGDWVYFDPPYVPVSPTANFTAYHANGFGLSDQERLRDICVELSQKQVYVMVSNSDTEIIRSLYNLPYFTIDEVLANRAINCNSSRRGKITELVITNYPVSRAVQLRLLEQRAPYLVLNVM